MWAHLSRWYITRYSKEKSTSTLNIGLRQGPLIQRPDHYQALDTISGIAERTVICGTGCKRLMPERDACVLLLPTNLPRARIAPQLLRTPTSLMTMPNIRQFVGMLFIMSTHTI